MQSHQCIHSPPTYSFFLFMCVHPSKCLLLHLPGWFGLFYHLVMFLTPFGGVHWRFELLRPFSSFIFHLTFFFNIIRDFANLKITPTHTHIGSTYEKNKLMVKWYIERMSRRSQLLAKIRYYKTRKQSWLK